jgi:XTP/dITP diphosphohydrolase
MGNFSIMFVTSNNAKIALANERLNRYGITITQKIASTPEIQSLDVGEVALQKAKQVAHTIKTPFIIEDSGLYIDKLNGFPGALMKPVLDTIGTHNLLSMLSNEENRSAYVKSVLVYHDPVIGNEQLFVGNYPGRIAEKEKGDNTRGWKVARIFIPKDFDKTPAEMDDSEWAEFLDKLRKGDHYDKFGEWLIKQNIPR